MRRFEIADLVICRETGVVGRVIKFYVPTASEEQTMVRTLDGRKYHAPTRMWEKYNMSGRTGGEKTLNPAGEYATRFAQNHRMSIAEAMEHPMVQARFRVFQEAGY